jgi:mRNA interferase HicA
MARLSFDHPPFPNRCARNAKRLGATRNSIEDKSFSLHRIEIFTPLCSTPVRCISGVLTLILGHLCPTLSAVTENEFIRKIRSLGRKRGVKVAFVPERGKGSHGTLYYGEKLTIVRNPKDELKTGTLHTMLTQLGLTLREL